jgi:hypothetical protein
LVPALLQLVAVVLPNVGGVLVDEDAVGAAILRGGVAVPVAMGLALTFSFAAAQPAKTVLSSL